MSPAILQLALDMPSLGEALRVAERALPGGVDRLEVGTPLIKWRGLAAVSQIRREFPQVKLVADMKTMDGAQFEVARAAEMGADVVTVLGAATDETLNEAVKTAAEWNVELAVDMIAVADPVARAGRAAELGTAEVCVHAGTASAEHGHPPLEIVRRVAAAVGLPVAVAGGMNAESAPQAVAAGASIIVVGSAIADADDPAQTAAQIKGAITR